MTSKMIVVRSSDQFSLGQAALTQETSEGESRALTSIKVLYQSNHQTEFLDLKAQVELLLQEVQSLENIHNAPGK